MALRECHLLSQHKRLHPVHTLRHHLPVWFVPLSAPSTTCSAAVFSFGASVFRMILFLPSCVFCEPLHHLLYGTCLLTLLTDLSPHFLQLTGLWYHQLHSEVWDEFQLLILDSYHNSFPDVCSSCWALKPRCTKSSPARRTR